MRTGVLVHVCVGGGKNLGGASFLRHNDGICVYGIVATLNDHRDLFERLTEGCILRKHMDDHTTV